MAAENTFTTLNGLFKEAYGERVEDLVPDGVKLLNKIDFVNADKVLGNLYHQPKLLI
jgi:hypothetical protein